MLGKRLNPKLLKLKLYLAFFRSTLALNWAVSLAFAILLPHLFKVVLPLSVMTSGSLISVYYKRVSEKDSMYFYYNLGLTRPGLFLFTIIANACIGSVLYLLLNYVPCI